MFYVRTDQIRRKEIKQLHGTLFKRMSGPVFDIAARIFKGITGMKIVVPGKFRSFHKQSAVRCSMKAQEGLLFFLEQSFFYLYKPPTFIRMLFAFGEVSEFVS